MSVHNTQKDLKGRWYVVYRVNGKQKRIYYGRHGEKEARKRDLELSVSRKMHHPDNQPSINFKQLSEDYLAGRQASITESTYSGLIYKLRAYLLPELGRLDVMRELTKARLDKFVAQQLALGKTTSTCNRIITDIQAIINFAVSRKTIPYNILAGYKKPRPDPEIVSPPTIDEMKAIDKYAPDHLKRFLRIIYFTGARPGQEVLNLKFSNINWKQNTLRIISAKKHGLKYRDIPLYSDFKTQLKEWYEADGENPDLHIVNYKKKAVKSLQTSWGRVKRLAKIERNIRPYSYRHAFVSMLLDSGADLKSVSELVGHSSVNLTLAVYQHTNRQMHRSTIDKLPAVNW